MTLTVGSLYAGIGGIDKAFELAGFDLRWANEVDKKACVTYRHNFEHCLYEQDIHTLDPNEVDPVNVLTAGFPCQPFSVAGYRKGFDDDRGNHFFRIMDFVYAFRPEVILLENVKNFETHDKGNTFKIVKESLIEAGYYYKHAVLNTMEYGNLPQNRERIYIVAFRDEEKNRRFSFPKSLEREKTIHDVLEQKPVDETFYYRKDRYMYNDLIEAMTNKDTVYQWRRVYVRENKNNVCPTLTANMGTGGHNVPLVLTDYGIRKLTPPECFRFQGFDDIVLPEMANSHLYKQAGNSVSVPVVQRIAEAIMKVMT